MPAPITSSLAQFAAELTYDTLPEAALKTIRSGVADCIAAMISGAEADAARAVRSCLASRGRVAEARLLLGAERATAMDAALLNSAAACANRDDRISAILAPAVLAEAETVGASGRDMMAAYAVGYEAWARLAEREKDGYAVNGWHGASALGVVAAAAAIANLRRLNAEQASNAMGLAAVMSGGTIAARGFGSAAFQMGRASSNGVLACRLAVAGLTAAPDLIERGDGLLRALTPKGNIELDQPMDDLGVDWRLAKDDVDHSGVNDIRRTFSAGGLSGMSQAAAERLFARLQDLDRLASVSELSTGLH